MDMLYIIQLQSCWVLRIVIFGNQKFTMLSPFNKKTANAMIEDLSNHIGHSKTTYRVTPLKWDKL